MKHAGRTLRETVKIGINVPQSTRTQILIQQSDNPGEYGGCHRGSIDSTPLSVQLNQVAVVACRSERDIRDPARARDVPTLPCRLEIQLAVTSSSRCMHSPRKRLVPGNLRDVASGGSLIRLPRKGQPVVSVALGEHGSAH